MWDSPKQSWTSPEWYSSIYLVFPKFLSARKWNSWKRNFTEDFAIAGTSFIGFWNTEHSFTLYTRRLVAPKKRVNSNTLLASRAQLLLRLGSCLFKTWPGFWTSTLITNEAGGRICTMLISTQLFITYSLMFLCFLGRVYPQIRPNNKKCVCMKSLYLEFQEYSFFFPKRCGLKQTPQIIFSLLCYFRPFKFPLSCSC